MAGLTTTLEIARNTLLNQQLMIQTASHNIANADNKYYARQQVHSVTNPATQVAAGWIGNGTRVDQITQLRDQYIEKQLLGSVSQESDYRTRSTLLGVISSNLSDTGSSGLSQDLGAFWDAWDALSQNPQGLVEKNAVLASANNLVDSLHGAASALTDSAQNIDLQITNQIPKINDLLSQIDDYNQRITAYEANGQPANDLRDLRYQALNDLSQYIGIDYAEQSNGAITVTMTDGTTPVTLVDGQNLALNPGSLKYDAATNLVSYVDASGTAINPSSNSLSGGSLSGELYTLGRISSYQSQLDTFTSALVARVNSTYDSTAATTVFDPAGATAASISISSGFTTPANINGAAATAVAALQDQPFPELADSTFGQFLMQIQSQIGQDEQSATSRADFQKSLGLDLLAQQQSVSGVSIDEETIDLLKFQQIYSAAAKIVSRTDEMLKTVIDMV